MEFILKENRDSTYISYILNNDFIFYDVGYKVLENQDNNGFIKCHKILHNGKIKLVYDISKYKSLEEAINTVSTEKLIKIISRLFNVIINIKDNGFIEYKNINSNLNTIFFDNNNLDIKLVYLPLNIENGRNEKVFIDELRKNLFDAINNSKQSGIEINRLCIGLNNNKDLQELLNDINSLDRNVILDREFNNKKIEAKTVVQKDKEFSNCKEIQKEQKRHKGFLGGIFAKRNKSDIKYEIKRNESIHVYDEDLEETSLISDYVEKGIAIKGINTPSNIIIDIISNNFIIGSSKEMSDGVLSFNKAISRRHCKISNDGKKYFICDLGSSNGTFLNGNKLDREVKYEIKIGDIIKIANSEFLVI